MGKNIHPLIRLDTDVLDELSAQETAIEPPELVQTAALDVKPNLADKKEKGTKANNGSPAKDSARASKELLDAFRVQQRTGRYQSMQASRKALPSWQKRDELISALKARHRVIVISGETGCGKTTQVPQYILDHFVETSRGAECKILCTQPRRISAIGVSERVAKERGENLAQTVGYQIRLESKMSEKTRILFCTTGILLRRLEGGFAAAVDSNSDEVGIDEFSHIIIDEVHERSLESDFLLMVLKDLLQIRKDLTVVLMSATLNANLFREYFSNSANDVPHIHMEGRTFPVNSIFLEDVLRDTRYAPPPGSELARRSFATRPQKPAGWGNMNIEDRPADDLPDDKLTLQEFEQRYASLGQDVVRCLGAIDTEKIHKVSEEKESRGILVFLPGYAEIQKLMETLMANRFIRESTTWIFPLHSTLSSEEQIRVFEWPDPGCVKVVISTNVAETSITVDDVVFVVDSGKMKETRFDPSKGMASLEEVWVSRASALQRRGRAGRVSEGDCIHMFTRWTFDNVLAPQQIPEIQRTALEQLCLRIKVLPFLTGKIQWVLSKVIEPPSMDAVKAAIQTLQTLRALTQDESLTPLGFHLGRLPVDVRIGKMILFGAIFKCLDPILTIASTLSIKSPFVRPFDKRQLADEKFKVNSLKLLTLSVC
ncbi:P-loop containing nucleoside triphosphate hydrolase protein [Cladochytrium replicatum]|nr:P-loop containing nucleoside triphosphate hydrolase protein [Cladochytrium replicatum]